MSVSTALWAVIDLVGLVLEIFLVYALVKRRKYMEFNQSPPWRDFVKYVLYCIGADIIYVLALVVSKILSDDRANKYERLSRLIKQLR